MEIVCVEWKSEYGKKFTGFFLKTKEGYRRVSVSTETFNFPEDSQVYDVVFNDIGGRLEKYDKKSDKIFGEKMKK